MGWRVAIPSGLGTQSRQLRLIGAGAKNRHYSLRRRARRSADGSVGGCWSLQLQNDCLEYSCPGAHRRVWLGSESVRAGVWLWADAISTTCWDWGGHFDCLDERQDLEATGRASTFFKAAQHLAQSGSWGWTGGEQGARGRARLADRGRIGWPTRPLHTPRANPGRTPFLCSPEQQPHGVGESISRMRWVPGTKARRELHRGALRARSHGTTR
jgi:hypothetical protein